MQQTQSNFSEFSEIQALKFLIMRDVRITLLVAIEAEVILENFKDDNILQQLALNKLINQINKSNKIHNQLLQEYGKTESLIEKGKKLKIEIRDKVEVLFDLFDNDQVKQLLYKYCDNNLDEIVNPFWQLIQQIKPTDISEQQMNFLKSINLTQESLKNVCGTAYTEQDIQKAVEERKKYIIEKIKKYFNK